ncbi:MAG: SCP2 sterol-binding domain-containing protein [Pseudomonadota bacterium]
MMQDASTYELVRRLVSGMANRLNKDAAAGLDAIILFVLSGDGGGEFAFEIRDQACTLSEGPRSDANATMKMSVQTCIDLAMGRTTGSKAFYQRKLKFDGDLNLVMKIHKLFPSLSPEERALQSS